MTPKIAMISDSIKTTIGAIVTFLLASLPINDSDWLEVTGKVLWIVASLLAISWWITRFRDRRKRNNGTQK